VNLGEIILSWQKLGHFFVSFGKLMANLLAKASIGKSYTLHNLQIIYLE
jgi:hypothetical protein